MNAAWNRRKETGIWDCLWSFVFVEIFLHYTP